MNTIPGGQREALLEVEELRVRYPTDSADILACKDVSLRVYKGETLGLVGESGCGKSTLAMAIMRLVPPPGRIVRGRVMLGGTDLLSLKGESLRQMRWREVALIPQGAMSSLNPVMRVGEQIMDGLRAHGLRLSEGQMRDRITDLLTTVGLSASVLNMYPHELSGGMKQRVCIAMAISLRPSLILADEPTSALDVVVQRLIVQTLLDIKERLNVSMLLIGHDMGLQAQVVDRIAVMYAGRILEIAPVKEIFGSPLHPYTRLLVESIPSIRERKPLKVTHGLILDMQDPPPGCAFQLRCSQVSDACRSVEPPLRKVARDHYVACHACQL
jgi:oligopeptide/dipeptide ABC transporter ATP-binding protein